MNLRLSGAVCAGLFTFVAVSTNAAFIGRLETSPGSGVFQAYYDDQLDITWTADADINPGISWQGQVDWAANLMIGGVSGWRLASMDVNNDGAVADCSVASTTQVACKDNEFGHLFWYGADATYGSGITASSSSPFSNLEPFNPYWSNTEVSVGSSLARLFSFQTGVNLTYDKNLPTSAWAVHNGDVGAVPVPAALWLFGSGLMGLVGVAKRKY